MKPITSMLVLLSLMAFAGAMYNNPFTWAMHRFYQYRGISNQDRYNQDRHGNSDNSYGNSGSYGNRFQERYVLQGYPHYQQQRSMGRRHQEQCRFEQCWDEFFMQRWGQGVTGESSQNGGQSNGFQNYEQCSEGVSRLRQCLQQQLNNNGGCGCEYRDMMWAVRTARDSDGMATYAFCDDFYNEYTERQCKDDQYRRCVQTIQRLSFAENRYRCDLRDEVSFAKQCINKYRSQSQPPSGCGNFNWFRYMEQDMEKVWMAEINGCPVYDIVKRCMNPMYEYFACSNQKDRVMTEYDQCIQKFANQDGRCSPMQEARKAMHQFMKFMLEQHCQSDRQVREQFQQCCHHEEDKKGFMSGSSSNNDNYRNGHQNKDGNQNNSSGYEEKKEKKTEEKKEVKKEEKKEEEKKFTMNGNGHEGNYEEKKDVEKKRNGNQQHDQDRNQYGSNRNNQNGFDKKNNNQNGFDKKNYNQNGFDKKNFNQNGFDKKNYNQNSFDKKNYNQNGFDKKNYNQIGQNNPNDGNRSEYEDKKTYNHNFDKKNNSDNQSSNFKNSEEKKSYNQQEDRKTKGGRHGNKNHKFSERGSNYDSYKPQEGEGRLAYLARLIKSWRDSQS